MRHVPRYEIVRFNDLGSGDIQIQLAINGILAPMLDDHKSSRERFSTDDQYFAYIAQQSELLIHLYGDARNPLSEDESSRRS